MGAVQRRRASGEPTATNAAQPTYADAGAYTSGVLAPERARTPNQYIPGTPTELGLYSGAVAYQRGGAPPTQAALDGALERAAMQRAERAGLPLEAAPAIRDYYLSSGGQWPAMSDLIGVGQSQGWSADNPQFGFDAWTFAALAGAAVLALYLLRR